MDNLVYGVNPVLEALKGRQRKPLELIIVRNAASPRLAALKEAAAKRHVPVTAVARPDLDRMVDGARHQGVALRVEACGTVELEDLLAISQGTQSPVVFLVLDGITDPHNLGAIARSAEAAGCQGLILPKDRSCPVTAVVEKAAAGALSHLPVCRVTNVARALDACKSAGYWVYGLAAEPGSQNLFCADLCGNVVLVVGSEGKGLRDNVRNHCDALLKIPMRGEVSSLNASVAAGIALFEVVRQQTI